MQITVELKELQDFEANCQAWARDTAYRIADAVPSRIDMSDPFSRGKKSIEHLREELMKVEKATPIPVLIPRV